MHEIEAFIVLNSFPHLGPVKIRILLEKFGNALNALQAPIEHIKNLQGFELVLPYWNQWKTSKTWQTDLSLVDKMGIEVIPFTSPFFPKSLLTISNPPVLLYVKGKLTPQDYHSISIVGTRQASIYGNEMAEQISQDLAQQGFTIVSGLARGIDTAAHRGALQKGRTLAIIGSGLADIYPRENHALATKISHQGALISEFSMTTPPNRQNFPQRNRIVSGMTLATLLIEAPIKSGSMITMEKAFIQKKKLFALPGRADHENFRGNHFLIKSGKAHLIENAKDILSHFEGLFSLSLTQPPSLQPCCLDKRELDLLEKMTNQELGIDALVALANLPTHQVHTLLMGLVLKKVIKEFPGKIYKKMSCHK